MDRYFKIGNIYNDLFSTGSTDPAFTKHGKSWVSVGHLRMHLHNRRIQSPDFYCHSPKLKTTFKYEDLIVIELVTVVNRVIPAEEALLKSNKRLFNHVKGKKRNDPAYVRRFNKSLLVNPNIDLYNDEYEYDEDFEELLLKMESGEGREDLDNIEEE